MAKFVSLTGLQKFKELIDTLLSGKANATHSHDERYYTETEVETKLGGKSDSSHTHDDRYYTETEVNNKLSGKADTHSHPYLSTSGGTVNGDVTMSNLTANGIKVSGYNSMGKDTSPARVLAVSSSGDHWMTYALPADIVKKALADGVSGTSGTVNLSGSYQMQISNNGYWNLVDASGNRLLGTFVDGGNRYVQSVSVYSRTTSGGSQVRVNSNGTLYRYSSSSRRYKEKITTELNERLDAHRLYRLPVVQYKYKEGHLDPKDQRYGADIIGFIAEDIEQIYPIAVNRNEDGLVENYNTELLVPPMLRLIQEQKQEIDKLSQRVASLEAEKEKGDSND